MTCGCSGPSLVGGARKSRRSGYCHCKSCRHCSKCHRCKKCGMKLRMNKKRSARRSRKMKGGSVLANALPSLVLYGMSRSLRKTKKNSNSNSTKTRRNRRGHKS